MMIKTYQELRRFMTYEERYDYLRIGGQLGRSTFGFERYLNQALYTSVEWKQVRNRVIIRDGSCDLGIKDREIFGKLCIHHLNPITIEDFEQGNECIFDLNNLICTSINTHNAIHFGSRSTLPSLPIIRTKGDTCPWLV